MAQPDSIWNLGKPVPTADDFDVTVEGDAGDREDGVIVSPDGSVTVDLNAGIEVLDEDYDAEAPENFDENIAAKLDSMELGRISNEVLEGIEADITSRAEWMAIRAKGIELLGLKLEEAKGDVGSSSAPVEGMSVVRHPILLKATLMAWANARAELLPAAGPVKVVDEGDRSPIGDMLAEQLEKDFNFFLTKRAREYYPDTDRLILMTCFGGSGFKKVFPCPMRRRPVSESVDAEDLIVNNSAIDLRNAARVTHRIKMRQSVMTRMKLLGVYRDVSLTPPTPESNVVEQKEAAINGIQADQTRPEDADHTVYECYVELDIPDFAPKQFKDSGLPLPYRVTIDKDSREILEIRRNWAYDDEDCQAKTTFVHYTYIRGFGFYGWGLLHLLGNSASALTAAWREALDAGMFANFPGFLIAKIAARQQTNELRVPAGAGAIVDTQGKPIRDVVMELPYRDVTSGLMSMIDKIDSSTDQIASTAELKVGEGRQDVPVGTMIAQIEQATKIESAVHKNMHAAQSEEFELLAELFREDPESFWRGKRRKPSQWSTELFIKALDTYGINPVADPNVPSHIHRVMKAMALKQLQTASPQLYDVKKVDEHILRVIGWDNPDAFFAPSQPAPDPTIAATQILADQRDRSDKTKLTLKQIDIVDRNEDRKLRKEESTAKIAVALAKEPTAEEVVNRTLNRN
jgi:hypothetical protein